MSDDATATVRDYYDALHSGDPLGPFFALDENVVKVGISERLVGGDAVAEGLRTQTEHTRDWTVESRDLRVTERATHAWFADVVAMGWTDVDRRVRYEFDTRWSGTLERRTEDGEPAPDGDWRFVGVHVSTADDL